MNSICVIFTLTAIYAFRPLFAAQHYGAALHALYDSVLGKSYHKDLRPACEKDAPVNVSVDLSIRQIINLHEQTQVLELNCWIRLKWKDCHLRWNPSDYHNITKFVVPWDNIWVPDITLFDNAVGRGLEGRKDYLGDILFDGQVNYNYPTVIKVMCTVDVSFFPFDEQRCDLMLGSWAFDGQQVDLWPANETGGDISKYIQSAEWDILAFSVKREVQYYSCCPEPFVDVTYTLGMRRKPLFYSTTLLFPCVLIAAVASFGFLLPPESGEKVSLEITVMLSQSVFMLIVIEHLPASSETFPHLGIYFALMMLTTTLSTLLTVITLNLHYRGVSSAMKVPRWLRILALHWLAPLIGRPEGARWFGAGALGKIKKALRKRKKGQEGSQPMESKNLKSHFSNKKVVDGNGTPAKMKHDDSYKPTAQSTRRISPEPTRQPSTKLEEFGIKPSNQSQNNQSKKKHSVIETDQSFNNSGSDTGSALTPLEHLRMLLSEQLKIMEEEREWAEHGHTRETIKYEWERVALIMDRFFFIVCTVFGVVLSIVMLHKMIGRS